MGLKVYFLVQVFICFFTVHESREGSGETVWIHTLVRALATCLCDEYQNLKCWFIFHHFGTNVLAHLVKSTYFYLNKSHFFYIYESKSAMASFQNKYSPRSHCVNGLCLNTKIDLK